LIPAGGYCLYAAVTKKPRYLGLAAAPLLFGLQQISEGFVWLALEREDAAQVRTASLAFLFFALAFWPFWFPFMAACMETQPRRKQFFIGLTVLSLSWFWILFYPLIVGPDSLLQTVVVHHSIYYDFAGLAIYQYVPKLPLRVLYLCCVALPPVFGSESFGRLPGLVLGASAVFAAIVYHYAFVSVWCFFASILAGYCCWLFYRLPTPKTASFDAQIAE
jgi:hypothetical protein